jgi:hypothetical protein
MRNNNDDDLMKSILILFKDSGVLSTQEIASRLNNGYSTYQLGATLSSLRKSGVLTAKRIWFNEERTYKRSYKLKVSYDEAMLLMKDLFINSKNNGSIAITDSDMQWMKRWRNRLRERYLRCGEAMPSYLWKASK